MPKRQTGSWYRALGRIAIILGATLLFLTQFILEVGVGDVGTLVVIVSVLLLVGAAVYLAGVWVANLGIWRSEAAADQVVEEDLRAPVLYLRSFQDETDTSAAHGGSTPAFLAPYPASLGIRTEEEQLTEVLQEIGPVVAIADPEHNLPQVGAARFRAADHEWQPLFLDQLSKAGLVVLRAGSTPGLNWEVSQVLYKAPSTRAIILVPYLAATWASFRKTIESTRAQARLPLIPIPNPTWREVITLTGWLRNVGAGGSLRGYVVFDDQWRGHFIEFSKPPHNWLRKRRRALLIPNYRWSFRPIFEALEVPWTIPPIRMSNVAVVLLVPSIVVALVVGLVLAQP